MIKFTGDLRLDFEKATTEILKLKDRILGYQEQIASLRETVKRLEKSKDSDKKQYSESLSEKDAIIKELQNRLAHAEALLDHDGSNTGTPTSQTPINKNKVINCGCNTAADHNSKQEVLFYGHQRDLVQGGPYFTGTSGYLG